MLKKVLVVLSIIILILIIIFQSYQIYNKTFSGYIFNNDYNMERVNIDYIVLSYNLLTIKDMFFSEANEDTVLSVFINNVDNKYNVGLQYWFNKKNFYPISMPKEHSYRSLSEYSDKTFSESIARNENEYIILVGKNTTILNVTTQKDISLFKVINESELEKVCEFDNTIYSLRENCKKIDQNEYFNDTMNFINRYIENYSFLYGIEVYDYIYTYADELVKNGEFDEANKYYNIYLTLNIVDIEVILNKARIYCYYSDYYNASLMINYCETLPNCDEDKIEIIKKDLEVLKK